MNVSLTQELEQFVRTKVDDGLFHDASEVVQAALNGMKKTEEARNSQREWLSEAIEQGWNEAQAGESFSAEEVKAEMARYKASRLTSRTHPE
jgi:antitoxin ParD1/3/4